LKQLGQKIALSDEESITIYSPRDGGEEMPSEASTPRIW